jgi:hypothetical protein
MLLCNVKMISVSLTDESHATHISSKIAHMLASVGYLDTVLEQSKVNLVELVTELLGLHELVLMPVCTDYIATLAIHVRYTSG